MKGETGFEPAMEFPLGFCRPVPSAARPPAHRVIVTCYVHEIYLSNFICQVRSKGFEPLTVGSVDQCSIQLSYERISYQPGLNW
jgi:hypothetical protein